MKNSKFKYSGLLLLLAVAALQQGCSHNDDDVKASDKAVAFSVITEKARAGETTALTLDSFMVFAQHKAVPTTAFTPNFMYAINVYKNSLDNWVYSPLKYRPLTGGVDFYAYSPTRSLGATMFMADATEPLVEYVVSASADLQEDFLIAKAEATYAAPDWTNPWEATGAVPMEFKHALSQIVFEARSELNDVRFIVKDISLTNLKPRGHINLVTQVWEAISGTETNYPADILAPQLFEYDPALLTSGDYIGITNYDVDENAMMVLPQTVVAGTVGVKTSEPGKSHIAITFAAIDHEDFPLYGDFVFDSAGDLELDANGVPVVTKYHTTYIPLDFSTVSPGNKFDAGKRYVFQLGFNSLMAIDFVLSVDDWDTTTVINID